MADKNLNPSTTAESILLRGTQTLRLEAEAINRLADQLGTPFVDVINLILKTSGRVVLTGVGKSADVGRKIVATLNSTGSPALFVHAGDAVHGDLGVIQEGDVVICLSKSGRSAEMTALPFLKNTGIKLIAISSDKNSLLVNNCDYFINSFVEKEACPNNLAPTTSTTAQLVVGDALAICLSEMKGFKKNDFAKFHPGGSLGKELHLKVKDLVRKNLKPSVDINEDFCP